MARPFYFTVALTLSNGGDGTRTHLPGFQREGVTLFGRSLNPKSETLQRFDKAAAAARKHLADALDKELEFEQCRDAL